jgi:hypothetical protein
MAVGPGYEGRPSVCNGATAAQGVAKIGDGIPSRFVAVGLVATNSACGPGSYPNKANLQPGGMAVWRYGVMALWRSYFLVFGLF